VGRGKEGGKGRGGREGEREGGKGGKGERERGERGEREGGKGESIVGQDVMILVISHLARFEGATAKSRPTPDQGNISITDAGGWEHYFVPTYINNNNNNNYIMYNILICYC